MGTSFGRGGATTFQQDLANADCIVIQGSNMAEAHPVGFQWVMEAKHRGATVIHVDPRFTRTSALADLHVPIRVGSDIAFLGGLVNWVLTNQREFREYVVNYTNAPVIIDERYVDAEDGDGLFSGWDPEAGRYDPSSWQYEGFTVAAASGNRELPAKQPAKQGMHDAAQDPEHHGATGAPLQGERHPRTDPTLEDPRCVFQILKRHFARYTPELVEEVCGVPPAVLERVARTLADNSGRERTGAFCYAVGWTQHTVGVQYIRTAAILQLLLGNIGRPGGGIMALRGHTSIQGSTDIPTLFNLLPGYIPMPHAEAYDGLADFIDRNAAKSGAWGSMDAYTISLLKSWWGDAASADNDWRFDYLPRISGDHSAVATAMAMLDGICKGYFLVGENPVVGTANGRLHRRALAKLDWLVVRDLVEIESATFWKNGPDVETGELRTEEIGTEVFLFPAAAHTEKDGSFTNTQRLLQWHRKAVEPPGDARSDLWFFYHLGLILRDRLADSGDGSSDPKNRPLLDLTWDYPTEGPLAEPSAKAVLAEVNGFGPDGKPLSSPLELKPDGSTRCGCWIYCGVYAGGTNQADRRTPGTEQSWVAPEWGWAWPSNRRILYNRASADPDGKPWSRRKALVWWDEQDPFITQADGKAWLFVPAGLADGPLPTHYEPHESPLDNPLYKQQANPVRIRFDRPGNRTAPAGRQPGAEVYPYVATTYRLTEHHTAGGMSRWLAPLAELQPEFFCEVSPELAAERGLEHGGWATIVSARSAVEARVLVTGRVRPIRLGGRVVHQIGLPYHWGGNGLVTGDAANDLLDLELDPNVQIPPAKVLTCDIRPGRRPRGRALAELVASYRRRAGLPEADPPSGNASGGDHR